MNNEIIPFGKYKGQPVDVLMNDRPYLEWLQGQDWFRARYQNINTLIINNFREPTETPEHNKLQAMFLDDDFLQKFIDHLAANYSSRFTYEIKDTNTDKWVERSLTGQDWDDLKKSKITFEENGIDISWGRLLNIEIKPVLSHDYPAVLRQMKAQNCNILFIDTFCAEGLTVEQVRKIFYPILIIMTDELT